MTSKFPLKTAIFTAAVLVLPGCFDEESSTTTSFSDPATVDAVVADVFNGSSSQSIEGVFGIVEGLVNGGGDVGTTGASSAKSVVDATRAATRATVDISANCSGGGSLSISGSVDDTTQLVNLSATFNNCTEGGGRINGTMSFAETEQGSIKTITVGIDLSMSGGGQSVSFDGDFIGTEDSSTGDFSDTLNFSIDTGVLAYTFQTLETVTGNFNVDGGCADGGVILITGTDNTRIQITILSTSEFQVSADTNGDGTFDVVGAVQSDCYT